MSFSTMMVTSAPPLPMILLAGWAVEDIREGIVQCLENKISTSRLYIHKNRVFPEQMV